MLKQHLITAILEALKAKAGLHLQAAKTAHDEATHEESMAEDKYDTRGLEASYLAAGQARMMEQTADALRTYGSLFVKKFAPDDAVDVTALVELSVNRKREFVFVGPAAGGVEVEHDGKTVLVITPESPLGALLMGGRVGDRFTRKVGPFEDKYKIEAVT